MASVAEALRHSRRQAAAIAEKVGDREVRRLLGNAATDLRARVREGLIFGTTTPTNLSMMRATMEHVEATTDGLGRGMLTTIRGAAGDVARIAASTTYRYMASANRRFGTSRVLGLREASMLSRAVKGADASVLRRLATTERDQERSDDDPDAPIDATRSRDVFRPSSVLERYSFATVGKFEEVLQRAVLTGKPWGDVREELIDRSPFLQGAPGSWAERIARTETMAAHGRAAWESTRAADDELGDVVKILSATIDGRTGWDSLQVHGQIRRTDEAFEWAGGYYQAPPNRPNDREIVVPHRISWPIPPELAWRGDGEVIAAWTRDRRKGSPPKRAKMTTIPLERFGKG